MIVKLSITLAEIGRKILKTVQIEFEKMEILACVAEFIMSIA